MYKKLMDIFINEGYEIYLVGGCVRDMIMNHTPKDYDLTTNATPEQMIEICDKYKLKYIETGLKHGTLTICMDNKNQYEVTTYRIDGKYTDGRRPDNVIFSNSLSEDCARRDFTINAIAQDKDGNYIDYYDGIWDINSHIIKCVGNPEERFKEDGLRILRAIRFAIKYGFRIEEKTYDAMVKCIKSLDNVSIERITSEIMQILKMKNCHKLYEDYFIFLQYIIRKKCDVKIYKDYYIFMMLRRNKRATIYVKFMLIFSDLRLDKLENMMIQLKLSNDFKNRVMQISGSGTLIEKLDRYYLRRLARDFTKPVVYDILRASKILSIDILKEDVDFLKVLRTMNDVYENDTYSIKQLKVNGDDIKVLGYSGKEIGFILNNVLNAVIYDSVKNDKESLLKYILKNF